MEIPIGVHSGIPLRLSPRIPVGDPPGNCFRSASKNSSKSSSGDSTGSYFVNFILCSSGNSFKHCFMSSSRNSEVPPGIPRVSSTNYTNSFFVEVLQKFLQLFFLEFRRIFSKFPCMKSSWSSSENFPKRFPVKSSRSSYKYVCRSSFRIFYRSSFGNTSETFSKNSCRILNGVPPRIPIGFSW